MSATINVTPINRRKSEDFMGTFFFEGDLRGDDGSELGIVEGSTLGVSGVFIDDKRK